jgi:hypothetical protein
MKRFAFGFILLSLINPGLVCAEDVAGQGKTLPSASAQTLTCREQSMLAANPAPVQDETIFQGGIYSHGGFAGPAVRVTSIDGQNEIMTGGQIAWLINHEVIIGLAGYGLTTDKVKRNLDGANRTLGMGYGGLEFGYVFWPHSLVHLTFETLVGAGGIGYGFETDENDKANDADGDSRHHQHWEGRGSGFFVAEPMLYLEMNVTKWFRINLGGGYRYVEGVDETRVGITSQALRGANAELLFKFGFF